MTDMSARRFAALLVSLKACEDALAWARGKTLAEAYLTCRRADWLLWMLVRQIGQPGWPTHPQVVLLACACAERALKHVPAGEDRPRLAIEAARRWAAEPNEAHSAAARAAADAAAEAAAARAAADAAAAWAATWAAWAATALAEASVEASVEAAEASAARAADAAASWAATAAAEASAARAAADAAEHRAMCATIRRKLKQWKFAPRARKGRTA